MAHHPFLTPSPLEADCGNLIGRDPREISEVEWSEHLPEPLVGMKAIRAKCLDCCGGNAAEVRKCVIPDCPLWPLRMGKQPAALRSARKAEAGEDLQ
ncbi:hypothetical protein [Paracoccus sp. (in: a-proteobacteria)]|uniref:hypothetical protein n=1 Tax=Paracoccus sp. TaxID=267 RepID=UPI0028A7FF78|nr:hypothetical protein [Paracoccus sp. (in: a-proteobacteria)]